MNCIGCWGGECSDIVFRHCDTSKVMGFISQWSHGDFSLNYSFQAQYEGGVNFHSNEYQGESPGIYKRLVHSAENLPPWCADSLGIFRAPNSWSTKGLYRPVMGLLVECLVGLFVELDGMLHLKGEIGIKSVRCYLF